MNESREESEMALSSPDKQNAESGDHDHKEMEDSTSDVPGQGNVDVIPPEKKKRKDKETKPYRCHVCRRDFDRSFDFSKHLRTHTRLLKADSFLLCFICGDKFKEESEVSAHLKTHEPDEIARCRICSEPFNHFTRLHIGPKPFKCSMCLKVYRTSREFHSHLDKHLGNTPIKCHICEKGFSRNDRLRLHKQKEHGIKIYKCEECKRYFEGKPAFEQHKKSHNELVYVQCDECNKVFDETKSLEKHRSFHNNDHFTCKLCDSQFDKFIMLKEHIRKHFHETSHECNICKCKFLSVDELNIHRKKHFKTMTNHQKKYFGPKLPFKCEQCPKSFYDAKGLKRHENTIHRDARHTCKLCGLEFSLPENLRAHITNIHDGENSSHQCTICWIRFNNAIELNNHNKKSHLVMSEESAEVLTSSSNLKVTKKPASATGSFSGSNGDRHKIPGAVKKEKLRKHVHPSGSTSVVSISGIYRGNNSKVNPVDETVVNEEERGELDRSYVKTVASDCICRFCGKCFSLRHYCCLHKKKHKDSEIVEKCSKCLKAFGQHDLFTRHRCTEGKIEPYECDICDEPFTHPFLLLRHRIIHKGPLHKCDKCKRVFSRKSNLERHKSRIHALISTFKCRLCHKYCFSKQAHTRHLKSHEKISKCVECNISFRVPSNLDKHMQYHHKVGNMYKCQTCEVEFSSVESYQVHQLTHVKNILHICDICGKKFEHKRELILHEKTHLRTKSLGITCSWCGMKFTAISSLRRHKQRNMCWRGRSFPCIICGDTFQRLDLLQTHTKLHIDSSKVLPGHSHNNEPVVNSTECVGDGSFENIVDQDNEVHISDTRETEMKRQNRKCSNDTIAEIESLNEGDVYLDDDLLGSDFPEQSTTSSVMFSCGVCNSEFSTIQDLQRHIDTHNTSQNANTELSLTHSPDKELLKINENSFVYDAEPKELETGRQPNPPSQDTVPVITSEHNNGIPNDLGQVPISAVNKDISRNGDQLSSGRYKCGLCEETFQDIVDLNDHISKHADDQNLYKCDICAKVFHSFLSFHSHCVSHVASDKVPGSKTEDTPTKSQRVNVFEMPFLTSPSEIESESCSAECEISTNNTLNINGKGNIVLHNAEDILKPAKEERLGIFDILKLDNVGTNTKDLSADIWKCNICTKTFDSDFELQRHKKQHTCEKETQVDKHDSGSQANAHVSSCNNTGPNDALQNDCAVTFDALQNDCVVTSIKLYKCGKCDRSFCIPSELTEHSDEHLLTDSSATCSGTSGSPLIAISPTSSDMETPATETPLNSTASNPHVVSSSRTRHTCGACACVFSSADALYSHCHSHVTSPTIKIRRWSIFDNNFSGSVLLKDLPSGVKTPMTNTHTGIQAETFRNESQKMFSSDVKNNDQNVTKKTNENNKTLLQLLKSKCEHASDSGLKIHGINGHKNLKSSATSEHTVSKDVEMMTSPNRIVSNDASIDSDNSSKTLKSQLRHKICSRLLSSLPGCEVHRRSMYPTDPEKEDLLVQPQRYACTDCHKLFSTAHALHLHEAKTHSKLKGLNKDITLGMELMNVSRPSANNSVHTNGSDKTASDGNLFKCILCDRVFRTLQGIRVHSSHHTGDENTSHLSGAHRYRCLLCRISFHTVVQLRSHVNETHNNGVHESERRSKTRDLGDKSYNSKHETSFNSNSNAARMKDNISHIHESGRHGIRTTKSSTGREVEEDDRISNCSSLSDHSSASLSSSSPSVTAPRDRVCKCLVCNRVFQSALEISCKQCEKDSKFPSPYKCLTCQRLFSSIKGIRIHMQKHHKYSPEKSEKRQFSDDTVNQESSSPKVPKLTIEQNGVHQSSSYHCLICVRQFSSSHELTVHMKMHLKQNPGKIVRQPSCTSSDTIRNNEIPLRNPLQDSVNPSVASRTGTMRYKCRLCPRLFFTTMHMLRHLKTHSQKYRCDMCGDVFSDVWTYQTHRNSHKITVSHMCHLCKKEFPTESSLVRHRKSHTGKSLPYRCDQCNVEFAGIEELTKHCITHKEAEQDGSYIDGDIVPNSNTGDEKILVHERGKNERGDNFASDLSFAQTSVLPNNETEVNTTTTNTHVNIVDIYIQSDSKSATYAKPMPVAEKQHFDINMENIETSNTINNQENENGSNEQIGLYKCDICNQSFKSLQEIGEHCRSHTETENTDVKTLENPDLFKSMKVSETNTYRCNICDREYMTLFSLQRHYKLHEGEMMYICHVCDKTFHQAVDLRQHLLTHDQDALFECSVCGQKYANMKTFKIHKRTHSHASTATCVLCCKDFSEDKEFLDHKIQCEKERPLVCDICGKGFTRTRLLTDHRKIHEDTRPYRCSDCGNRYKHMLNLKRHMETAHHRDITSDKKVQMEHGKNNTNAALDKVSNMNAEQEFEDEIQIGASTSGAQALIASVSGTTGDRKYKCIECNEHLPSLESLRRHKVVHLRENNECTCNGCGKDFSTAEELKCHIKEHHDNNYDIFVRKSQEKEGSGIACSVCGKYFQETKLLQQHVQTMHTAKNIQTNQCCVCGIMYEQPSELEKHLWMVHRERQVMCDFCGGRFCNKDSLNRHVIQKHNTMSHNCPECPTAFSTPDSLQRHIAIVHPQQPYACSICNIQFQSMSEKQRHMSSTHAQSINARVKSVQWATKLNSRMNKNCEQSTEVTQGNIPNVKHKRISACRICRKTFQCVPDRQMHMVEVHGATTYNDTCSTCGQMFATKSRLKLHEAIHTGVRPFPCHICHNVFRSRGGLSIHLQYHAGERQYSCPHCDKKFLRKNHLLLHAMRAHPRTRVDISGADSD